jgi:hypothetical protein
MIALPLVLVFAMLILIRVSPLAAGIVFLLSVVGAVLWFLVTHFTIVIVPL